MAVRIEATDTLFSVIMKVGEGNPGAIEALIRIDRESENIDKQNMLGGLSYILELDKLNIYGTDIYVLYSDICAKNLPQMLAVLRSVQLGFLDKDILRDACSRQDYSGRALVPVEELYIKVKERLEKFDRN